jgi:DNA-binding response OmpR family regulator
MTEEGASATPASVLIADDDRDIRDLVAFKLEQAGFDVLVASDGADALEAIRQRQPAVAILDVMMPRLSGMDVLSAVRAEPALQGVRVILLTARSRDVDVDVGFASGADDYVIKPFSPRELLHRVNSLLSRSP